MGNKNGRENIPAKEITKVKLSPDLKATIGKIGLDELLQPEVAARYAALSHSLAIGLKREGKPTMEDGGLFAIPSGIQLLTSEDWDSVQPKTQVVVSEVGGTNFNLYVVTKTDTGIERQQLGNKDFPQAERQVPLAKFIDRIAEPILENIDQIDTDDPILLGLSFGFPHNNRQTDKGLDVDLMPDETGTKAVLSKEWAITDFATLAPDERNILEPISNVLEAHSIHVAGYAGMNDTIGVAQDRAAAMQASTIYDVLPVGLVGGTGTNSSLQRNPTEGIIITEIGQGQWPDDAVAQRMRKKLIEKGILKPDQDQPKFEHELGQYIPLRLAAGIELLGEKGVLENGSALAAKIEALAKNHPALISELATGERWLTEQREMNTIIQGLAQATLHRAEQVYGIFVATSAAPVIEINRTGKPAALLTEGSALLFGHGLRAGAERIAKDLLGEPIKLIHASGVNGIAQYTMASSN